MNFKSQRNLKNHHKIPLYPPFPKGEANISSLWPLAREGLWPGGKREAGRDFQSAKVLQNSKQSRFGHLKWVLGIYLGFVIWDFEFQKIVCVWEIDNG